MANMIGKIDIGVINLTLMCVWFLYLLYHIRKLKKRMEVLEKG